MVLLLTGCLCLTIGGVFFWDGSGLLWGECDTLDRSFTVGIGRFDTEIDIFEIGLAKNGLCDLQVA